MSDETDPDETFADHVWYERFKFCGCGNPEDILGRVRDALRATQNISDAHLAPGNCYPGGKPTPAMAALHKAAEVAYGPDKVGALLLKYILARADLTEHGGSVNGAWLSTDGKRLLTFLESTPEDQWLSR